MRSLVLVALFAVACTVTPLPNPPPAPEPSPAPVPDPWEPPAGDACGAACSHLRALHCPDGEPTPAGTPCEAVCAHDRADEAAMLTDRYLGCLATIRACSEENGCPR